MEVNSNIELNVDPRFKKLIRPLRRQEYLHLEHSLLTEGCKDPILTWEGIIIDGHNRYEICRKHKIPFVTEAMYFSSEEAVVAWICEQQLKRVALTEEMRRYLIGTQFECEKEINKASRPRHRNQYSGKEEGSTVSNAYGYKSGHRTATRIAEENHISYGTVEKYAYFARAIEAIRGKVPELCEKILSGQFKISHNALLDLARMKSEELRILNARLAKKQRSPQYSQTRSILQQSTELIEKPSSTSIKDMPAFDPDASANELALTIPTWVGSIERVQNNTDFSIMTPRAKKKLADALSMLESKALELFIKVQEE